MQHIYQGSILRASPDAIWAHARTIEGVNAELEPLLKMTVPDHARGFTVEDAPLGERAFQSWILLGGVVPVDRHGLKLNAVEPGTSFFEESTSWLQARWLHMRTLNPHPLGCLLVDRVRFTPRIKALAPLLRPIVARVFAHRHARLRAQFGTV